MKRILTCLCALLLVSVMAWSQGAKRINSIKRSSQYLYAEATMPTAAEALEVANDLLLIQIKEYTGSKKAFEDKDILIRNINSSRDSVQLRRGDMIKVFLYVKKSDIQTAENATLLAAAAPEKPQEAPVPGNVEKVVLPEPEEKAPEAAPGKEDASLKLELAWQQNVVDQLLGATSFSSAKALLSRMKAEYKIKKTGPLSTCKNPAECFMLIGKDGKVETVLGPGSSTRTDFRTLTSAPATLPAHMDIIWFTFAK